MEKNAAHHSRLNLHEGINNRLSPDTFTPSRRHSRPTHSFVISRKHDGSVLSYYGDSIWDFSPYKTNHAPSQTKLYFSDIDPDLLPDCKWVLFIMMYMSESDKHSWLSINTILIYYKSIVHIAGFALRNNSTIIQVLESENLLTKYINQCEYANHLKGISPIIRNISYLGHAKTGINIFCGRLIEDIDNKRILLSEDKQHPVIPPRIYSHFITNLQDHIKTISEYTEPLSKFLRIYHEYALKKPHMDKKLYIKIAPPIFYLMDKYNLTELFDKYDIKTSRNISRLLARTQHACKTLIHIYSGMRSAEAFSLKIGCFHFGPKTSNTTPRLIGETSKLTSQRKPTAWITSADIEKAINLAQWLAQTIADFNDFTYSETPLFVSTSYLMTPNTLPKSPIQVSTLANKKQEIINCIDTKDICIDEDDIRFLEKVDPLRPWRDEPNFQSGKPWRFTSHQFRRSLAFYAVQSSLVSLPSLKRQLKHITQEMTIYYSRGSSYLDLFQDNEHFANFYLQSKPESDALAYLYDVILSNEPLYGAHGTYVNRSTKQKPDKLKIINDRKKLNHQFRNGELAYQNTPLGGCTTLEPCNKKLMREISACVECKRAVIKPSKFKKVINRQTQLVKELKKIDSTSLEYRMEKSELNTLIKYSRKILNKDKT